MKKIVSLILAALTALTAFASCGKAGNSSINVIIREESSGTRSAFVELLGITDENGNDASAVTAEQTSSTAVMLTSVAGNKNAIGYVSLGSLSDEVKAIDVDGVSATLENVKSGKYAVARPFILTYNEEKITDIAKDFISFILSKEGQKVIEEEGYVSVAENEEYKSSGLSGKITLAGSTSVSPVMDKLKDTYRAHNPDVEIEITQSGSSAGIESAIEGVCNIGMSSRELKDDESKKLTPVTIAMDGIAVIVNLDNSIEDLTSEEIAAIFKGETESWDEVK